MNARTGCRGPAELSYQAEGRRTVLAGRTRTPDPG